MTTKYAPATQPTMYFIGVTTGQSSIMKVFPRWAEALGQKAVIKGIDLVPKSEPELYREVVEFIKNDSQSLGALVTTHKLNLLKAARDLFDGLDGFAQTLDEISCIYKRNGQLRGEAKDPITAGLSLEAIVEDGYWRQTGGHMLMLGSGGSSLALSLYLHNKALKGGDVPSRIIVTGSNDARLAEMKEIHRKIGFKPSIEYRRVTLPEEGDAAVAALPPASMVINATGLGKDRPGSPLSDKVVFPENGVAWEFNYRGNLVFLDQARAAEKARNLKIEDGWVYFIHGWTRVIAEVFNIDIPTSGPSFDRLSEIAKNASSRS